MEYPKFDSMTVTIFPRHLKWLNRRFRDAGINRSLSVREALELLIAKVDPESVDQVTPESEGGAE